MEISLRDRRALVTGANSGIGASIAKELAAAGARVAVNFVVDPDAAAAVVAEIRKAGGEAVSRLALAPDLRVPGATSPSGRTRFPAALEMSASRLSASCLGEFHATWWYPHDRPRGPGGPRQLASSGPR